MRSLVHFLLSVMIMAFATWGQSAQENPAKSDGTLDHWSTGVHPS